MMLITREGLFIRSQSCGSRGGRGTFWNLEESYVYTYMLTGGRVGWLRGRGDGNGDREEQAAASGCGRS